MTPIQEKWSDFIFHELLAVYNLVFCIVNRGEESLFSPITFAILAVVWATFAGYELGELIWRKTK